MLSSVMAALDAAIHARRRRRLSLLTKIECFQMITFAAGTAPSFHGCHPWMAGTSPAMTPKIDRSGSRGVANSCRDKSLLGFVHCLFSRQSPLEPETATGKAEHDKGAMRVEAMGVNLGLSKVSLYSVSLYSVKCHRIPYSETVPPSMNGTQSP